MSRDELREEVEEVIRECSLDDFIEGMPDTYETGLNDRIYEMSNKIVDWYLKKKEG